MKKEIKNCRSDLKIIVVGNSGTGKTSFVNKWTKNIFTDSYRATIVSEFGYKIFEYKGKFYRIQLWDIAGLNKFYHIKDRIKIHAQPKFFVKMHMDV